MLANGQITQNLTLTNITYNLYDLYIATWTIYTFTLLSAFDAHELMRPSMSSCDTKSLLRATQRRGPRVCLGSAFDRSSEQTLFSAEKLRSTVAVLVAMAFFRFMSFIRLAHLFLLIGSPSRKSIFANASLRTNLLMSKQSKCSTR